MCFSFPANPNNLVLESPTTFLHNKQCVVLSLGISFPSTENGKLVTSLTLLLFQGCDAAYLTNLHAEYENKNPCYFKDPKDRRKWDKEFGIRHYAGTVIYSIKGFVDKNRDSQQDVFFDTLAKSKCNFVQELCAYRDLLSKVTAKLGSGSDSNPGSVSKGSVRRIMTNKAKPTVSDAFRLQLQVLVEVLQSTNPWYVRCIKPNMNKAGNDYDDDLVLDQLRYLGMTDIIRIRKQGFPIHYPYEEFMTRYRCFTKHRRVPSDAKTASK